MTTELVRGAIDQRRCALYRHYDERGVLLYVGITDNLGDRTNSGHARTSDWVQFAERAEAEWYDSRELASNAERVAVRAEEPIYNRQYAEWDVDRRIADYLHDRQVRALQDTLGAYVAAVEDFLGTVHGEDIREASARARADYQSVDRAIDQAFSARILHHLALITSERTADIRDDASGAAFIEVLEFLRERLEDIRDRRKPSEEPPF